MQHQKATVSFSFMFWVRIVHPELSFTGHGEFSFQYFSKKKTKSLQKTFFRKEHDVF